GMGLAAAGCVGLAAVPTLLVPALTRAVDVAVAGAGPAVHGVAGAGPAVHGPLTLRLSGIAGSMSPVLVAAALAVAALAALAVPRLVRTRRARREARLWDC